MIKPMLDRLGWLVVLAGVVAVIFVWVGFALLVLSVCGNYCV
jgi:hypothetical protein